MAEQISRSKGHKKENQEERNYNIKLEIKDKFTYNVRINILLVESI